MSTNHPASSAELPSPNGNGEVPKTGIDDIAAKRRHWRKTYQASIASDREWQNKKDAPKTEAERKYLRAVELEKREK